MWAEIGHCVKVTIHRHVVRGRIPPLPRTSSMIKEYFTPATEYYKRLHNKFTISLPEKGLKTKQGEEVAYSTFIQP
jgi:hypothetical protein